MSGTVLASPYRILVIGDPDTLRSRFLTVPEVIRLAGYTEDEKLNIARRYLLPKQEKNNGVKEEELLIAEDALRDIVRYYTREAGVRKLEREVAIARVRLAEAEALQRENERLKAVLRITRGATRPVAVARLIGSTSSSARRFAYLSAGRSQGVRSGMPVTSPLGLVGRVLEAGSHSSRVLLLTDSESMVPVRRAGDDVLAFAEGRADGLLRVRLINLGINPLKRGDVFVTSGAGGLFRPGIAVAVAVRITEDGAIAQLLS